MTRSRRFPRLCLVSCLLLGSLHLGLLPGAAWAQATATKDHDDSAIRLEMPLFGGVMQVEVRDTPRDQALEAMRQALLEMFAFAAQVSPDSQQRGSLGEVNRNPDRYVPVTGQVFDFVVHALRYCLWSGGVQGPLGGEIYRLWDGQKDGHAFAPFDLRDAVAGADCSHLGVEENPRRVRIAPGSRLSGFGMQRGFAMDLAVAELRRHGITNAILETDSLISAFGQGASGHGWLVQLPGVEGSRQPLDQLYLLDQSLAWVAHTEGEDDRLPINHRTGVPTVGVRLVAVVTPTAADSEALANTLYAMGHTLGQRHVGALDPRPSVFWLLGSGTGLPLESPYRWSELDRVRTPR